MYAAPRQSDLPYPPVEFWTSTDGQTWTTNGLASTGQPYAFAFDGDAGVAVGIDVARPPGAGNATTAAQSGAVWTSPNGSDWARLPEPPVLIPSGNETRLWLSDVAHGPAGYVALGTVVYGIHLTPIGFAPVTQSVVFWSPDGHAWHRDPAGLFGHANLLDIVVVDGRYVVMSRTCSNGGSCAAQPVLWTSLDGRHWVKEPAFHGVRLSFANLVMLSGKALLAGVVRGGSSATCATWRSPDGLAWTWISQRCPQSLTPQSQEGLLAGASWLVASAAPPARCESTWTDPNPPPCARGIEVSTSGEQWTYLSGPTTPTSFVSGGVIAASADELLWVGSPVNGGRAGLWITDLQTRR